MTKKIQAFFLFALLTLTAQAGTHYTFHASTGGYIDAASSSEFVPWLYNQRDSDGTLAAARIDCKDSGSASVSRHHWSPNIDFNYLIDLNNDTYFRNNQTSPASIGIRDPSYVDSAGFIYSDTNTLLGWNDIYSFYSMTYNVTFPDQQTCLDYSSSSSFSGVYQFYLDTVPSTAFAPSYSELWDILHFQSDGSVYSSGCTPNQSEFPNGDITYSYFEPETFEGCMAVYGTQDGDNVINEVHYNTVPSCGVEICFYKGYHCGSVFDYETTTTAYCQNKGAEYSITENVVTFDSGCVDVVNSSFSCKYSSSYVPPESAYDENGSLTQEFLDSQDGEGPINAPDTAPTLEETIEDISDDLTSADRNSKAESWADNLDPTDVSGKISGKMTGHVEDSFLKYIGFTGKHISFADGSMSNQSFQVVILGETYTLFSTSVIHQYLDAHIEIIRGILAFVAAMSGLIFVLRSN
jgi:hypothetical protein